MNRYSIAALLTAALFSTHLHAHEQGSILVRAGIANVDPDASSSALVLDGTAIGASEADVDDNTQLGLTFAYMLTDHFAVEVLASTPFSHDISAFTGALGLGEIDAGETKHLPPTVSFLYYPNDSASRWQPYVGAGLNYTLFFDESTTGPLDGVDLSLDDSFGLAAQLGADISLSERMFLNLDIRWMNIETDASLDGVPLETVVIDPMVYSVNIGWTF